MEIKRLSYVFCFIYFVLSIFFSSCQPPASNLNQKPYFDLTSFFEQQIKQLNKDSLVVVKTSSVNGTTDQHQMDWTDWKKEFTLYLNSDINKSSMIGKYKVDSVQIDSIERKIIYSATDSSLRTRLVEVTFENQAVDEIHIINHASNFLSTTHEELYFHPMKNYVIKSSVKNRFFGENEFSLLGQIVPKQKQYF